ncbi:MAG TPA: FAD-binding oxidoreductase, partial [Pseudolysinimonas sp.]|nr:FAD-binding oxidoreductase [Pseudolysinimonas sp.]
GLGVVTEATVGLVEMPVFYGGALFFDIEHARAVLDGWLSWTATADPQTTTSVAALRFPDIDEMPPPLRGRHLLSLRFARPGGAAEGEALAAPLRALAPVHLDDVSERPATEVARIHSDPEAPTPGWTRGAMLTNPDAAFADALLPILTSDAPFLGVEIRHIGAATERDVPETSAVGGRENDWALTVIGVPDPTLFADVLPAAYAALRDAIAAWVAPSTTINWLVQANDPLQFATAWPPQVLARLSRVRAEYDPDHLLPYAPVP